jgi:FRG domain
VGQSGNVYGIKTWRAWERSKPSYLGDTKQVPRDIDNKWIHPVHSFRELFRVVAFLNVMNKTTTLLFRGQTRDLEPRPTLLRDNWTVPGSRTRVDLSLDRVYYWDQLGPLCDHVSEVLSGKLPRHAPFDQYRSQHGRRLRIAPWAVIQHYELWPTPLVDLTSSLRVAASFALGVPRGHREGYVYVYDVSGIVTDLMELTRQFGHHQVPEPITYRLSAVCPPSMDRPHLQEGFLMGNSQFGREDLTDTDNWYLADRLVAKFHLLDDWEGGRSKFWSSDFPKHRLGSLLPRPADDEVKRLLDTTIHYEVIDRKAAWRTQNA